MLVILVAANSRCHVRMHDACNGRILCEKASKNFDACNACSALLLITSSKNSRNSS